ncbi:MAG: DCC1-like thiol-disulfide oxidoreductase family protein [Leeuwenhoekiella sp.]
MIPKHKIILFDGACNLCNAAVNFVIKNDKNNRFKFASLQSAIGKDLLKKHSIEANTDSIILIDGEKSYIKSTAALQITRDLDKGYPLFYSFIIIPKIVRHKVYDFIAKNRYKWFGTEDSCMIPTQQLKSRFLD